METNNITSDKVLRSRAFKLIEDAEKMGYWADHSIEIYKRLSGDKVLKRLSINIEERPPTEAIELIYGNPTSKQKNQRKVLKVISDNPGLQTKGIHAKLASTVTVRTVQTVLSYLLKNKLIIVKSTGKSKSDPTRQFFPNER